MLKLIWTQLLDLCQGADLAPCRAEPISINYVNSHSMSPIQQAPSDPVSESMLCSCAEACRKGAAKLIVLLSTLFIRDNG